MLSSSIEIKNLGLHDLPNYALDISGIFFSDDVDIQTLLQNKKYLHGSYAICALRDDGSIFLSRDQIGTRKLFYALNLRDKTLHISSNFIRLGHVVGFESILSVPAGGYLLINTDGTKCYQQIKKRDYSAFNIDRAINVLQLVFKNFSVKSNNSAVICLSGGLDSTLIAYLAKNYFSNISSVCAVFLDDEDIILYQNTGKLPPNKYLDFENAKRIADYLDISLLPIVIPKYKILENLENVMLYAQDWRDFNVHCAVLNYSIAEYISNSDSLKNSLILTGDFMNEVFADYTSEVINHEEYYIQPNISKKAKQRFLLKGLDSSDRELGIFANFGLKCIQPYACVIDEYKKLLNADLNSIDSKYKINGAILPPDLLNLVGKSKLRAQSGDLQGGILGHFVRNGYKQNLLNKRFIKSFGCPEKFLKSFIYVGSYRTDYS